MNPEQEQPKTKQAQLTENGVQVWTDYRSPVSKLIAKFFPGKYEIPDLPEGYNDGIVVESITDISIQDRIRILFSGRVMARVIVFTKDKAPVHKVEHHAFFALPPKFAEIK